MFLCLKKTLGLIKPIVCLFLFFFHILLFSQRNRWDKTVAAAAVMYMSNRLHIISVAAFDKALMKRCHNDELKRLGND